jgi:DNA-directed RNA polymerase specialized sigma subunit
VPEQLTVSGSKAWTISAPDIERAIQTLVATLDRTPTDNEIAQQPHISVAGSHQAQFSKRAFASPKIGGAAMSFSPFGPNVGSSI